MECARKFRSRPCNSFVSSSKWCNTCARCLTAPVLSFARQHQYQGFERASRRRTLARPSQTPRRQSCREGS